MSSKTYALLIYRTGDAGDLPPERVERALVGHRKVQAEAAERSELRAVAKLSTASEGKTVARRGSAHDITDGPFIDSKEWLVGFYLVDCETEQQAIERAKAISPIEDHAVEVRLVDWCWEP